MDEKIIDYYECPGCGYRISPIEYNLAITNFPCPSRKSSHFKDRFNWCGFTHYDYKPVYKINKKLPQSKEK